MAKQIFQIIYLSSALFVLLMTVTHCEQAVDLKSNGADTTYYDVVFRESKAGVYKKWQQGVGSYGYYYTYTDRGRGPVLSEQITLDNNHFIKSQSISGLNYLKDSVYEYFEVNGNRAQWINSAGKDQGEFLSEALYFRYDGTPASYEILAQMLMKAEKKSVKLYPKGLVTLMQKYPITLGDSISTQLLMIKGLDMNPVYLWLTNHALIGKIAGNLHIIRTDFQGYRKEMKVIQDSLENQYLFQLATDLSQEIDDLIIKNVNIFTAEATLKRNQDVWVRKDKIKAIAPSIQSSVYGKDARIIDGTGKTLMPGMFDMHTHNTKFRGALHLAGGVTSVRDLANNKQVKALSHQFNSNQIIGPRIVTFCGIIDGPGPFANQRNVVENLDEGLAEIQVYKDLGYQQIKLYSSIKPAWVKPMADKAHQLGMRVSGHIPAYMTASQAIDAGYNEIQHMNMLFLNFMSDTIDTRTPLRFTMVANHGAKLDLSSPEYLTFVKQLKAHQILIDPTLSIFENMFVATKGMPSPTYEMIVDRLPLINQRSYYKGGLPKPLDGSNRYMVAHERMLDVVYDLYQKGVDIVPGTDGLPGFLYHRELELFVKSGIPIKEVLKMATIKSAVITGVADAYGSIEVGKQADLILISGNPLERISDIRKVLWTTQGGYLYEAEALYASMGIDKFN
jgi:imidazolonepropionase-like amidohydrolase|tara:strand:- start:111 stop:2135 length:2025 start_codon:yes stop_codon:yes gene_type:complete